jgi:CRP/FNR family transcriptional activator FtrB
MPVKISSGGKYARRNLTRCPLCGATERRKADMRPSDQELLTRTELYRLVGPTVSERLTRGSLVRTVPRGAVLTRQGEMAEYVHLILSGRVLLMAAGNGDHETVITTFGPGEMFVTPASILELPYLVTSRTSMRSRILMIPSDRFRRALQAEPSLALMAATQLARHWRLLLMQIQGLKLHSAKERVIAYLLRGCPSGKNTTSFKLSNKRNVVAAELGMTPESLSRTFNQLRDLGVEAHGRLVKITDIARLAAEGPRQHIAEAPRLPADELHGGQS